MGKKHTIQQKRFDGGMSDTPRETSSNKGSVIKHFDIFSNPHALIPYRSTENDMHDGSTATGMKQYDVRHFQLGSDGKIYGLGKVVANSYSKVVSKADPTTGNWTLNATAEGGALRKLGCFIEWQGNFYMFTGTNRVSYWTIGSTFTENALTLGSTILTTAQGIIGADDNLYLFYNNKVVRVANDGTTFTDDVCAGLPSNMRITSVCPYGSYLAIGMAYGTSNTGTPSGISKVFLWDMVTTTTVTEVIDWGEGALMVLGNIEGRLVGVSDKYMSSTFGLKNGSMIIKMLIGGTPKVMSEITTIQTVGIGRFLKDVVIKGDKIYWVASVPMRGSTATESTKNLGIWCFGRKDTNSDFVLTIDYIEDGVDTTNWLIRSFGSAGNYWFINHSVDGSITKTDDTANYTTESVYETLIYGDGKQNKKLVGVRVITEAQPTAGITTLKYRKNGATTWRIIFIDETNSSMVHEAINLEPRTATMTIASPCVVSLTAHGMAIGDSFYFTTTGALPTGVSANTKYYVITAGFATDSFRFAATSGGTAIVSSGSQSGVHTLNFEEGLGNFREVEFQIISYGGTVITGFEATYEEIDDKKYE